MEHSPLILASQSPRRKELLSNMGYTFDCIPADIDETPRNGEKPTDYVSRLAKEKAECVAKLKQEPVTVIGSDTIVVFEGKLLGKPENLAQCQAYLTMLSGTRHQVLTAVSVVQLGLTKTIVVSTEVDFVDLTQQQIVAYWQSGEPKDKAGAYGIQGIGGQFVRQIQGSYSNVVGLPLVETAELLASIGLYSAFNPSRESSNL